MKLRKSMIEDFDICPLRFKYIWIDGVTSEGGVGSAAYVGTLVHDFAAEFFDVVKRDKIEQMMRIDELMDYFTEYINEEGPEKYILGCENFCKFEMEHLLALRKAFKDPDEVWHYWKPFKTEFHFEVDNLYSGTIDRASWLEDGTLIVTDYKPKISTTKHRREVTWYGHIANTCDLFDGVKVTMGSVYAYLQDTHWMFKFHPRTLQALNRRIKAMNECIKNKDFPPKLGWLCVYCPGKMMCPAMKEGEEY